MRENLTHARGGSDKNSVPDPRRPGRTEWQTLDPVRLIAHNRGDQATRTGAMLATAQGLHVI